VNIGVKVSIAPAKNIMAGLQERLRNLGQAMAKVGEILRGETLRNFREGGVFPAKWKPSGRGGQTLVDKAILRNSIVATSTDDTATVGTSLKYGAIHQFGGVITAKNAGAARWRVNRKSGIGYWTVTTKPVLTFKIGGRWISKKSVTIPARPFLPVDTAGNLSPDAGRRIGAALLRHIKGTKPSQEAAA
jgi:phage gpG-like protein